MTDLEQKVQTETRIPRAGVVLAAAVLAGVGFCMYARVWEERQPKEYRQDVRVESVEPYSHMTEVHTTYSGTRVRFEGEERPIDYPDRSWDSSIESGDMVDVVVRRSYPVFGHEELDGISVRLSQEK